MFVILNFTKSRVFKPLSYQESLLYLKSEPILVAAASAESATVFSEVLLDSSVNSLPPLFP